MILKPRPFRKIRKGHPLAKGLVGCWLMNEGGGNIVQDLSGNGVAGITDGTWIAGPKGPGLSFNGSTQEFNTGRIIPNTDEFTIVCSFKAGTNTDEDYLFDSSFGATGIMLRSNDWSTTAAFYAYKTGPTAVLTTITRDHTADFQQVVCTRNNTEQAVYIDGKLFAGPTATGAGHILGNDNLMFAADYNPDRYAACEIEYIYIYNRCLAAGEAAQIHREPFCMFEREPIELWVGSVGAAVTGNPGIMTPNTGFWGPTY